jgi:hypothetical protein
MLIYYFVCWWLVCFFESSNIWVSTYIQQFAIDAQKKQVLIFCCMLQPWHELSCILILFWDVDFH